MAHVQRREREVCYPDNNQTVVSNKVTFRLKFYQMYEVSIKQTEIKNSNAVQCTTVRTFE